MNWILIAWPVMAAMCLTIALIHVVIWASPGGRPAHLAFVVMVGAVIAISIEELLMMFEPDPARYAEVLRNAHVFGAAMFIAMVSFVRLEYPASSRGLFVAAVATRLLALVANFTTGENLNFRHIDAIATMTVWGGVEVGTPVGTVNPWTALGQLNVLLILVFLLDTMRRARRDHDEAAARVWRLCLSFAAFVLLSDLWRMAALLGYVRSPDILIPSFLCIVLIATFELGREVLRSGRLAREVALHRDELAHLSRVALLSELSGSLAHELNQPLTAILSNAQAGQRFLARDPPELDELREILQLIVDNDKRAGEVIRRLGAMLRKEPARHAPLDVDELVGDVMRIVRSDLMHRHTRVRLELAGGLPLVSGDAVQLQQVLINLLMNACDAMMDRPEADRQVVVATRREGRCVRVSVRDCGHGIPAPELERIFEPFVTTKATGLGLGLAVCSTIIRAHHGRLFAQSPPGGGAIFSFELPIA